ncbi:Nuclear receptor-binding-like protein [Dinothrombium tinctorium]|uniref:Nuclear receptor-binding protein homolog n=1 Tax=Dinothrombium tinctorium TaxID=1965070 RepID=A0A443RRL3_9ACAR|nr:Nuclear receptor-binding-like protein [Dinothrombium tinctorium]
MVDSRSTVDSENKSNREQNEDSEDDESEILEESPCGRWLKRREEVEQRDIPGIDATYLAMDTEEGVEVVWNEVRFSERKYFNAREEKISEVFDRLIQLKHPNIVKLHKYWMDKDVENPRVIFITEYMSSGSLKQFLKKTKRNVIKMALPAWKRWCTQILSALCYLHSSQPPIIHANLTCDTIFISHNGLIKIGAVAPDAIHRYVKTVKEDSMANIYYVAPELGSVTGSDSSVSSAVDIYSFGMCALEMAALEITGNGETGTQITDEIVNKTIESLDNPLQKDFIRKCLQKNPALRPTARELLFHPVIFEVPSLRLLSAHVIVNTPSIQPEQLTEEALYRSIQSLNADTVLAEIIHKDGRPGTVIRCCDAPRREVEKFLEEVRNGAYPLTAIMPTSRPPIITRQRTTSPALSGEAVKQSTSPDNPYDEENRRIINMMCNIKAHHESDLLMVMTLLLRMDDKMNRQLSCEVEVNDSPMCLADELVYNGFINQGDRDMVATLIADTISRSKIPGNCTV